MNRLFLIAGVKIPPPPQSFAKVASKPPPPEKTKDEQHVAAPKVETPQPVKPIFPPLEEARDTKSPVTDLSNLPSTNDMLKERSGK
jgi:hypothetical protein